MTQDITSLIEKLEGAEAGSQEIDAAICVLFQYGGPNSEGATNVRTDEDWEGDLLFEQGKDECCNRIPAITTSLDAALALAERVLPGVMWWLSHQAVIDGVKYYHAEVSPETEIEGQSGYAATPALALCAALIRAQSEAR